MFNSKKCVLIILRILALYSYSCLCKMIGWMATDISGLYEKMIITMLVFHGPECQSNVIVNSHNCLCFVSLH